MPKTRLRTRAIHKDSLGNEGHRPAPEARRKIPAPQVRTVVRGDASLKREIVSLQPALGNQGIQRLFGFGKKKKPTATAPDTRSPERKLFDAKTFKKDNWKPSTGGGKFDAEYKPTEGILHIKMRVHFNFQDADPAYKSEAADPKEMKWTSSGKKDWTARWIDSVMGKWGKIAPFTCDMPGFTDVAVTPQIEIEPVKEAGKGHYSLDISKAFKKKSGGMRAGGASGVDRVGGGMFQEQDAYDKINNPKVKEHLKAGENTGNILPAYQRDRERLITELGTVPSIVFKTGSDEFDAGGAAAAADLAKALLKLRESSALSDLHPVNIMVGIDTGETRSLLLTRFRKIKDVLDAAGAKNAVSAKQASAPNTWAVPEAAPETQNVKDDYVARWDRYTSAHEFGHMIGLLDEYCPAVSPELILKMVNEGAIATTDTTLSKHAQGKVANNAAPQKAYAELLDKTKLSVPTWARPGAAKDEKSTSLMSGGFQVLRQHHITLWEVLAEMTKADIPHKHWKV